MQPRGSSLLTHKAEQRWPPVSSSVKRCSSESARKSQASQIPVSGLVPTHRLSMRCQTMGFNPQFNIKMSGNHFKGSVSLHHVTITTGDIAYSASEKARYDVALMGLAFLDHIGAKSTRDLKEYVGLTYRADGHGSLQLSRPTSTVVVTAAPPQAQKAAQRADREVQAFMNQILGSDENARPAEPRSAVSRGKTVTAESHNAQQTPTAKQRSSQPSAGKIDVDTGASRDHLKNADSQSSQATTLEHDRSYSIRTVNPQNKGQTRDSILPRGQEKVGVLEQHSDTTGENRATTESENTESLGNGSSSGVSRKDSFTKTDSRTGLADLFKTTVGKAGVVFHLPGNVTPDVARAYGESFGSVLRELSVPVPEIRRSSFSVDLSGRHTPRRRSRRSASPEGTRGHSSWDRRNTRDDIDSMRSYRQRH